MTQQQRNRMILIVLGALAILVISPFIGSSAISPIQAGTGALSPMESEILWRLRIPRVCLGFLAGCGLAVSGMVYQSMFRNALATPYTLGVSSGASLGAAIYVVAGVNLTILGISGISLFAFVGASLAILLIYAITLLRPGFSGTTTLLAGVAVSVCFSSLILFVQYLSDFSGSFRIMRWLMGGLDLVGYDAIFNTLPFVLVGVTIVAYLTRELNLLTVGTDIATSRGVDCIRTKRLLFFATSLMVGGIVAVCGPIGFVGMMAPHVCRLLVGHKHEFVMPTSAILGGAFLVACDSTSRAITTTHAEIPVGIITALFGGPFFLWLLLATTKNDAAST